MVSLAAGHAELPVALLDDFACDGCVAPPRGFRPAGLLAKVAGSTKDFAALNANHLRAEISPSSDSV